MKTAFLTLLLISESSAFSTTGRTATFRGRSALFEKNSYEPKPFLNGDPAGAAPAPPTAAVPPGGMTASASFAPARKSTATLMDQLAPIVVQGGALKTCSVDGEIERVQVILATEGRPMNSNVELWQGPDRTPQKIRVYCENGSKPFRCVIETPGGTNNAVAIYNTGHLEFPLAACVDHNVRETEGVEGSPAHHLCDSSNQRIVQGGAVFTTPFNHAVASVHVMLKSDGRPLNARVELLQGPNNDKQVMECYAEDGDERPFYAIINTPGDGNVVRIVNTASVEFPLICAVEPYLLEPTTATEPSKPPPTVSWNSL